MDGTVCEAGGGMQSATLRFRGIPYEILFGFLRTIMEEFETLSEQLARVTAECERLRGENARLCGLLSEHELPATGLQTEPLPPKNSFSSVVGVGAPQLSPTDLSVPEKIALFRSLFRGR